MSEAQRRAELERIVLEYRHGLLRPRDVDPEEALDLWLRLGDWVRQHRDEWGVCAPED